MDEILEIVFSVLMALCLDGFAGNGQRRWLVLLWQISPLD
jgi:hypothetical protein